MTKQVLDHVSFKETCLCRSDTLHRNGRHPLADREHFRRSAGDVLEEAVHGRQALVAGANVVATVYFEMFEEADNPLEAEVGEREACDLASLVGRGELEEAANRVPVAAD